MTGLDVVIAESRGAERSADARLLELELVGQDRPGIVRDISGALAEAGISIELFRHFTGKLPILGVCLGHQALGAAFGGRVIRAPHLMHGKTSPVMHDNKTVFQGLPMPMTATRYHSLIVEEDDLPDELEVSAWTTEKDGTRTIMGLRHRRYNIEGVQFHPESVLTDAGKKLVANFLHQ